jgi:hypothetical protein
MCWGMNCKLTQNSALDVVEHLVELVARATQLGTSRLVEAPGLDELLQDGLFALFDEAVRAKNRTGQLHEGGGDVRLDLIAQLVMSLNTQKRAERPSHTGAGWLRTRVVARVTGSESCLDSDACLVSVLVAGRGSGGGCLVSACVVLGLEVVAPVRSESTG